MHLTLLHVGETPQRLRDRYERFVPFFQTMFKDAGFTFDWHPVNVLDGEPMPAPDAVQGVVITGSAYGVYDETPWMEPLRRFIRDAYAARTPMVGVCFGHQIMADALGGDVGKSDKGWGIGRHTYRVIDRHGLALDRDAYAIACSHQDQVRVAPRDAQVFLASEFTPNAGLVYGNGAAISVQPHPEFDRTFAKDLCELRRDNPLADAVVDQAVNDLDAALDRLDMARTLGRFLTTRAAA
jgi:GMP synthase-like glutamine amidotransferase